MNWWNWDSIFKLAFIGSKCGISVTDVGGRCHGRGLEAVGWWHTVGDRYSLAIIGDTDHMGFIPCGGR